MDFKKTTTSFLLGLALGTASISYVAAHDVEQLRDAGIQHVLLISIDGLHALDVSRFIESHPNSALAELARHGVTYSNANTPANSDSFPGLLALVTGGS